MSLVWILVWLNEVWGEEGTQQIHSKLENTKELLSFFRHNNGFAVTF